MLLAGLLAGGFLLWRLLGEEVYAASVARDSVASGPEPEVHITGERGGILVEGEGSRRSVGYEVTRYAAGRNAAAARERASGMEVDLERRSPGEIRLEAPGGRSSGADWEVHLPARSSVEVSSGAGDVAVSGVSGSVRVAVESGDVTVRGAGGDVLVEVRSGDVEISGLATETGRVGITVETGDLLLRDVVAGALEAQVASGDVLLAGRFSGSGNVSTGTGDIRLRVPSEDVRHLSLATEVGEVVREEPEPGRA